MRKPSKPCNHFLMPLGIIQIVGKHRALAFRLLSHQIDKPRDRFVLHREVFAVFEHQINEHTLDRLQLPIEIRGNPLRDEFLRAQITGEGFGVSR